MLAAIAMAMSSVTVVGNSILLGRYKPKLLNTRENEQLTYTGNQKHKENKVADNVISRTSIS